MSETTQRIISEFLQQLAQRDLSRLANLFAEKVDWYIPGDEETAPWLGRRSHRSDVRAFYELLWSQTEPVSASIEHIFIDGDHAAITGEFSTKMLQTGKIVNSLFSIHIKVQNEEITKYRLLEDSLAVSRALTI